MIRADIYFALDYLHQKKIVDRLRFSALSINIHPYIVLPFELHLCIRLHV
jgi:hypothetical protein